MLRDPRVVFRYGGARVEQSGNAIHESQTHSSTGNRVLSYFFSFKTPLLSRYWLEVEHLLSPPFAFISRNVFIHISSGVKGFSFNRLSWLDGFDTNGILPAFPREMSRVLRILFRCDNSVGSENMWPKELFALKKKWCLQSFIVAVVTQWSWSTVPVHLIQEEVLERADSPLIWHCLSGHRIIRSVQVCQRLGDEACPWNPRDKKDEQYWWRDQKLFPFCFHSSW